jgi:hypothetical protein
MNTMSLESVRKVLLKKVSLALILRDDDSCRGLTRKTDSFQRFKNDLVEPFAERCCISYLNKKNNKALQKIGWMLSSSQGASYAKRNRIDVLSWLLLP